MSQYPKFSPIILPVVPNVIKGITYFDDFLITEKYRRCLFDEKTYDDITFNNNVDVINDDQKYLSELSHQTNIFDKSYRSLKN